METTQQAGICGGGELRMPAETEIPQLLQDMQKTSEAGRMGQDATVQERTTQRRTANKHLTLATIKSGITEKQWQGQLLQLARLLQWKHYHTWNSMHSAQGFPDLVLVRERVIYVELKSQKGECSAYQLSWIEALRQAGQEVYVWRPDNFDDAVKVLSRRAAFPPTETVIDDYQKNFEVGG